MKYWVPLRKRHIPADNARTINAIELFNRNMVCYSTNTSVSVMQCQSLWTLREYVIPFMGIQITFDDMYQFVLHYIALIMVMLFEFPSLIYVW